MKRKISFSVVVCLPTHNCEKTIKMCIDSILSQTFIRFELLIADDGSTDGTLKIAESYHDDRIRILRLKHDFIHTLNTLMDEAQGKYIARMDAGDVMMPERLKIEVDYLKRHPEVDVVGGNLEMFGLLNAWTKVPEKVSLLNMLEKCGVYNSTTMVRRSSLEKYGVRYEPAFTYAEDYRFWVELLKKGAIIRNLLQVTGRYRVSEERISYKYKKEKEEESGLIKDDIAKWIKAREDEVKQDFTVLPESGSRLSVVIAFLNEGEEVGRTVRSVRETAGNQVDIIIVNDHSDDGYDYETDLEGLGVHYYFNNFRIGAAASKEKGVQISSTPYFILLDAHMRFYDNKWTGRIVGELDKNGSQLLCCQTKVMTKFKNGHIKTAEKDSDVFGAYVTFEDIAYIPGIQWNVGNIVNCLSEGQIPAVLGAGYSSSKSYWNKLKGLQGLIHYGGEEQYISLKAWLEGGGCRLLNDVVIGHIYRAKAPYQMIALSTVYNYSVITQTLFPTSEYCKALATAMCHDRDSCQSLTHYDKAYRKGLLELRKYYSETFKGHDFSFIRKINDIVLSGHLFLVSEEKKRLETVMSLICSGWRKDNNPGLFDGNSSVMLAAVCYGKLMDNEKYIDCASDIMNDILRSLSSRKDLPVTFENGLCGIGWALIFLIRHGLLEDSLERELTSLDYRIMERDVLRTKDQSLETGTGGVLAYVTARLGMKRKLSESVFDEGYLKSLCQATQKIIDSGKADSRLLCFALQYIRCMEGEWLILEPQWKDILNLPTFLSKEERYQKQGLRGRTGFALFLTDRLQTIKSCRPFLFNNNINTQKDENK